MRPCLAVVLVAFAVVVHTAGCGRSSNTVEFPENPDPMPKEPPVAAGAFAPSASPARAEAPKAIEQP